MEAPTFFDYIFENQGGRRTIKFLKEMKKYIPYKEIEELLIKEGVYKQKQQRKKEDRLIQVL